MISAIILSSLVICSQIQGAKCQQGSDMSDEDFKIYAETHEEHLKQAVEIIFENREIIIAGAIGGATGHALRTAIQGSRFYGGVLIGGAVDFTKNVYKGATGKNDDEKLESVKNLVEDLRSEVSDLRQQLKGLKEKELETKHREGDENRAAFERERDEERNIKEGYGNHDYRSDSRECGPHRETYREHKQESHDDRKTRETVESTHRDPVKSDNNYVEKR